MNVLLSPQPPLFPHEHISSRQSPSRSMSPFSGMAGSKKRKADDEGGDEMSVSPMSSPAISSRQLSRPAKKARATEVSGRPLPLPRLLEALDAGQLRTVLQTICDHHPDIAQQVAHNAPRPVVASTLEILEGYQARLQTAMPYGQSSADYTYYRVKQPLLALVEAVADFTRQFLPPVESHTSASLQFLDGATKIVHGLPDWDSPTYRQHKEGAYDELARAWALVLTEASKRGSGTSGGSSFVTGSTFSILSEHWDQVLAKHHQQSGGRLGAAMSAMAAAVGWMSPNSSGSSGGGGSSASSSSNDPNSIRNQLLNGTFGSPVRVGPW